MTQRPQQAPYDPMGQIMQVMQLLQQQNQQAQGFDLEQQQLDMRQNQFDAQLGQQDKQMEQQKQQAIMAALSRGMPQTEMGADDPTALYNYLQQMGVPIPGMSGMQQPAVNEEKLKAQAIFAQLGQP